MAHRHARVRKRLKYHHAVVLVPGEEGGVYYWTMTLHDGELVPVSRSGLLSEAEAIAHCHDYYGIRPNDWVSVPDDPVWLGQFDEAIDNAIDQLSKSNESK